MGKMIAVCGSPNCGKTTAALKLAQEIYGLKKTTIHFLSPDLNVPSVLQDLQSRGQSFKEAEGQEIRA